MYITFFLSFLLHVEVELRNMYARTQDFDFLVQNVLYIYATSSQSLLMYLIMF